ncbi:MAG: Rieske 2Fe-2S domain-containing protein, partial [Rhodothermales bacterium]
HLGAHLGYGGTVEGDILACPFHSWRFDGEGVLVEVPYAKTQPDVLGRRCLKSWPVVETNRSIYVWYHPRNQQPAFDVTHMPELMEAGEEWTALITRQWTVHCHIQEAHENILDAAHFRYVHGVDPDLQADFTGHQSYISMAAKKPDGNGAATITEHNGPGQTWSRYTGFPEFIMLNPVTPIDDEIAEFHVGVAFKRVIADKMPQVIDMVLEKIWEQIDSDIPIFEHKIYRTSPLYCDGDGPIEPFRQWYAQFYAA